MLSATEIVSGLQLSSSLVVLSGCETAQTDGGRMDEMEGLLRALFVAGAERIVVALWRVDTQATKELMRRFYAAFSQSRSAAQGLQTAAIELRNEPRWNHPYYWAPFVAYEA